MNSLQLSSASQSRMMKVLLLAFVLTLLLVNGSALKCHKCVPYTPGGRCTTTQETCGYKKDTCVAVRYTVFPFSYFQRCISKTDCMILQVNPYIKATCCQTDLCNTPVI